MATSIRDPPPLVVTSIYLDNGDDVELFASPLTSLPTTASSSSEVLRPPPSTQSNIGFIATSTSGLTTTSDTKPSSSSTAVTSPSFPHSSPTVTPSPSTASSDTGRDAGVGVACGTIIILIAIIVLLLYRQRKRTAQDKVISIPQETEELWSKRELPGHSAVRVEAPRISPVEMEARRAVPAELETVERSQELPA